MPRRRRRSRLHILADGGQDEAAEAEDDDDQADGGGNAHRGGEEFTEVGVHRWLVLFGLFRLKPQCQNRAFGYAPLGCSSPPARYRRRFQPTAFNPAPDGALVDF